jgi:transcriptional regulator with XRE-family HTH domain
MARQGLRIGNLTYSHACIHDVKVMSVEKTLWIAYVEALMGDDNQTQAAARTGIAQTTIGRWLNGVKAPTEAAKVAAFAQGYEHEVLEAFVAAGMLTEEQAGRGLPARSKVFLRGLLSDPADELPAVADNSGLEGSGDHTP